MHKKQIAWLYAGYCFLYIYFRTRNDMGEYNATTVGFI
ncbi:hypothetical protein SAMN04488574_1344 [Bacillus sp. 71mf]|nr:hypothetical protein SAMN04488574_1344 [Bacillus sp. 71mf]SFT16463.1 hypothetical protein SAMN04488145_11537 [Bacillus sp. 103mf]